jgi:hypothetical protein
MDVPWLLKPSRLSEDETVRSVEESRPTRGRCVISFGDPDTTKTTGEAVRPFLSEEMSRAAEVLTLSRQLSWHNRREAANERAWLCSGSVAGRFD